MLKALLHAAIDIEGYCIGLRGVLNNMKFYRTDGKMFAFGLQGEDNLTTYTFGSHKAKLTFCRTCGVQSFYTPRSNPDGYGTFVSSLFNSVVFTLFIGIN